MPGDAKIGGDLVARIRDSLASAKGVALQSASHVLDWRCVASHVAAIDEGLTAKGIPPDSTVAVMGRNNIETALILLGVVASGRCAAIINPFRAAPTVLQTARAHAPVAVLLSECDPVLEAATDTDPVLVVSDDGRLISRGYGSGKISAHSNEPRAGIVISTSGTTGEPKPFHLALPVLSRAIREIEAMHDGFGDRARPDGSWPALIQYSPLSHIGGALTLFRAIAQGRATAVLGKFEPEVWAQMVEQWQLFTTGLPPSMMRMVLKADIQPSRLSSLVSVWSGTAPLRPEDRQAFIQRYGLPVLGNYGATEFCGAIAAWSLDDFRQYYSTRSGAVGRIHPSVAQARVRSPEGELIDDEGAVGILEFKVGRIGNSWIQTSDVGSVDAEGFLTLHGRTDDAIIRGGFKLSPRTIADTLRQHPAVRDAAVVGIAHERLGQVPVAVVEMEDGTCLDSEELQAFVRSRLPAYFVPAQVRATASLPRNATMKVDRRAIGAMFEQ